MNKLPLEIKRIVWEYLQEHEREASLPQHALVNQQWFEEAAHLHFGDLRTKELAQSRLVKIFEHYFDMAAIRQKKPPFSTEVIERINRLYACHVQSLDLDADDDNEIVYVGFCNALENGLRFERLKYVEIEMELLQFRDKLLPASVETLLVYIDKDQTFDPDYLLKLNDFIETNPECRIELVYYGFGEDQIPMHGGSALYTCTNIARVDIDNIAGAADMLWLAQREAKLESLAVVAFNFKGPLSPEEQNVLRGLTTLVVDSEDFYDSESEPFFDDEDIAEQIDDDDDDDDTDTDSDSDAEMAENNPPQPRENAIGNGNNNDNAMDEDSDGGWESASDSDPDGLDTEDEIEESDDDDELLIEQTSENFHRHRKEFIKALPYLNNLETMELEYPSMYGELVPTMREVGKHCTSLKSFGLTVQEVNAADSHAAADMLSQNCRNLERLYLASHYEDNGYYEPTPAAPLAWERFANLQTLLLLTYLPQDLKSMAYMGRTCPNLRVMSRPRFVYTCGGKPDYSYDDLMELSEPIFPNIEKMNVFILMEHIEPELVAPLVEKHFPSWRYRHDVYYYPEDYLNEFDYQVGVTGTGFNYSFESELPV